MQITKHVVYYRLPKKLQWDKEFPEKRQALAFVQEVEEEGGVAMYIECVEEDGTEIGLQSQPNGESDES